MSKKRVLIRTGKLPFVAASPLETLHKNLTLTNTGNLLFQHAFIRSIYRPDLEFFSIQDQIFNNQDIQNINENFDAVYLTFANAFRPSFRNALKNWSVNIKSLNVPVFVIGIGAQCQTGNALHELQEINNEVKSFCEAVLEKSASIGVRGDFTADYLNDLGIKNVDVIGCPSMFYFGAKIPKPKNVDFHNLTSIGFHFSPQSSDNINKKNLDNEKHLMDILQFISSQNSPNFSYIAQDTIELRKRIWGVRGQTLSEFAPALSKINTIYPVDPHTWIKDLEKFEVVLGTRIHGTIASVLAGTPAFILCHDSRTSELSDLYGLPRLDHLTETGQPITGELLSHLEKESKLFDLFPARFSSYIKFLSKNRIPYTFDESTGTNPFLAEYDQRIEEAGLLATIDNSIGNIDLLNEKINFLFNKISASGKTP